MMMTHILSSAQCRIASTELVCGKRALRTDVIGNTSETGKGEREYGAVEGKRIGMEEDRERSLDANS